jgi:hypothetical protein
MDGNKLHDFIKRSAQNLGMTLQIPKNLTVPNICRYNQKIAMLRAKFKEEKRSTFSCTSSDCGTLYACSAGLPSTQLLTMVYEFFNTFHSRTV